MKLFMHFFYWPINILLQYTWKLIKAKYVSLIIFVYFVGINNGWVLFSFSTSLYIFLGKSCFEVKSIFLFWTENVLLVTENIELIISIFYPHYFSFVIFEPQYCFSEIFSPISINIMLLSYLFLSSSRLYDYKEKSRN